MTIHPRVGTNETAADGPPVASPPVEPVGLAEAEPSAIADAETAAARAEEYQRKMKVREAHRRLLAEQGKPPTRWG